MILQCFIIDDEPLARKGLREYISDMAFLRLTGEFDNPLKAMDAMLQGPADLLFLDIQMPKMNGLDLMKSIPEPPMVIFTTAWPQYAVEGFELNAVDYLVKPFSFERFCKAVMKARRLKEAVQPPAGRDGTIQEPAYFFIKSDGKLLRILYDDILFAEALQNYVAIHTATGRHITYLPFYTLEQYLPGNRFIRTHKSFIIAMGKVESIEGNEIRIGSQRIPISRAERERVMEKLLHNRLPRR